MNVLALIPANDRPHQVKHKNTIKIAGRSVLDRTLDALEASENVIHIAVITNDSKAARISHRRNADVVRSTAPIVKTDNLLHVMDHGRQSVETRLEREFGAFILAMAPVPLRPPGCFDRLIEALETDPTADDVLWVYRVPGQQHPFNYHQRLPTSNILPFELVDIAIDRQKFPPLYCPIGAGSIFRRDFFLRAVEDRGLLHTCESRSLICQPHECIDINEPIDVDWAEFLLQRQACQHLT